MGNKARGRRVEITLSEQEYNLWKAVAIANGFIMLRSEDKNKPHFPNMLRKMTEHFANLSESGEVVAPKHLRELISHFGNLSRLGTSLNTLAKEVNTIRLRDIDEEYPASLIPVDPENLKSALDELRQVRNEVAELTAIFRDYMGQEWE